MKAEAKATADGVRVGLIDLDGIIDEERQIEYMGYASRGADGVWKCQAVVRGAYCIVEVKILV